MARGLDELHDDAIRRAKCLPVKTKSPLKYVRKARNITELGRDAGQAPRSLAGPDSKSKNSRRGIPTKGKAGANSPDYQCSTIAEEGAHESINNVEEGKSS
jgi:hypothetical protein